jgi:hypothetical protein
MTRNPVIAENSWTFVRGALKRRDATILATSHKIIVNVVTKAF